MKKLLFFFLAVQFLFFGSCAFNAAPPTPKVDSFSAKAIITQNSATYTADFEFNKSGCSVAFLLPEEISGFRLSFNGNQFTYTLGKHYFSSVPPTPNEHFLPLIFSALTDESATFTAHEAHYSAQGYTPLYSYYLNIDKNTCAPLFLEIEEADLTVHFKEIKVNKSEYQA